ncbi:GSCFA domain-containing protein [Salegentibacter flavus]|uniref:GSCFA family protein n=1 Tax=Salegentibacter flavus TaxID=287099 RepID=A0A1I5B6B4_9FLAO|nr:GSCFA domain-containing protein [Salegentibacter flavus]SFN70039.1 GSCFA family protein [Salegentibacter flavus]
MEFRTSIPIKEEQPKIGYDSKLLLLGSCFVENIGAKLEYHKIRKFQNPFGIFFHPQAIETFLERVVSGYRYFEEDVFFYNERWHCFEAHSALSDPDKDRILDTLNQKLDETRGFLKETSHVVITLGTAWNYTFLETGLSVANCHKLPQKNFRKELSSVASIIHDLKKISGHLEQLNSKAELIFTISPIRHLRDGFVENQHSKSNLISAVHSAGKGTYFPSYEIMMDELRDYRFYAEDMLHPSPVAIDYIWKRFIETWFSEDAMITLAEVENIQKGLAHRPFNPESEAHSSFLKKLKIQEARLREKHPHLKF